MQNPCYDRKTHTDCSRRAVGCSADCPDWAKYEKERNHIREARFAAQKLTADLIGVKGGIIKHDRRI